MEEKLFYNIAEASKITGVKPYILRYWESEFNRLKPDREKGRRRYRKLDIELILKIKKLLYKEGFRISGAKSRLNYKTEVTEKQEEIERLKTETSSLNEEIAKLKKEDGAKKEAKEEITKLKEQLRNLLNLVKKDRG